MPKFFCISDIHSFYEPMIEALNNAGFNPENPEHILVVCGDVFDRGPNSAKVLSYLRRLERKILIKGNHEQLLVECCERGYPGSHDFSNGTHKTICDLGGADEYNPFDECCTRTLARVATFLDDMVNYFETEHYIFVHGWIPVNCDDGMPAYYRKKRRFSKMENFREATQQQWDDAMWLSGPDMALDGYNNTGKTIVFGHWHTSYLWSIKDGRSEFGDDAKFDIFYGDNFIAIDACTAYSGKVNCLVIEDNFI
jgi:serine/threonine protein phosphatase 1